MDERAAAFARLTAALRQFQSEYSQHDPAERVTAEWSAQDVLRHVTSWHRYYVANLDAEAHGARFVFPATKYSQLNQEGVETLRGAADEVLVETLNEAHRQLGELVLSGKVTEMTYRAGAKPYPLLKFIEVVEGHIKGHSTSLTRARGKGKPDSRTGAGAPPASP